MSANFKYKKKRFKRILKELGVYNSWIYERKRWLMDEYEGYEWQMPKDIFSTPLESSLYLEDIIDDSFDVHEAENSELWRHIYNWFFAYNYTVTGINFNILDSLKQQIQKYLN